MKSTISVHLEPDDAIKCTNLRVATGTVPVLRIGDLNIFASPDQLDEIEDACVVWLANNRVADDIMPAPAEAATDARAKLPDGWFRDRDGDPAFGQIFRVFRSTSRIGEWALGEHGPEGRISYHPSEAAAIEAAERIRAADGTPLEAATDAPLDGLGIDDMIDYALESADPDDMPPAARGHSKSHDATAAVDDPPESMAAASKVVGGGAGS